ncbi:regulatory protein RecX [Alloscardovia criceti]|uniref:regulatory protein RecX n=1 Tax=Alloscardovia criceti TaxID=356828 RepID=UPI00036F8052|nr:regulatory protein RecX [Alloscardovia criceti]
MISAEDFLHNAKPKIPAHTQTKIPDVSESQTYARTVSAQEGSSTLIKSGIDDTSNVSLVENPEVSRVFRRSEAEDKCQEAALRLLDAAPRPSGALRDRLLLKDFDEKTIETVIARLTSLGLVNDAAYAKQAVRYCISRKMGERGTLQELRRKGVDNFTAKEAVSQAAQAGEFVQSAYDLVESVARKTRGLDKQVRLRRLWSAAGRKGHALDLIKQAQYEIFTAESEEDENL